MACIISYGIYLYYLPRFGLGKQVMLKKIDLVMCYNDI